MTFDLIDLFWRGTRDDIEQEDDQESYFKWLEEHPNEAAQLQAENEDENEIDYDDDGNIIVPEKSKIIDPLPPIDHTTIDYEPFEKNFYHEHEEIKNMSVIQTEDLRKTIGVKVRLHLIEHII